MHTDIYLPVCIHIYIYIYVVVPRRQQLRQAAHLRHGRVVVAAALPRLCISAMLCAYSII